MRIEITMDQKYVSRCATRKAHGRAPWTTVSTPAMMDDSVVMSLGSLHPFICFPGTRAERGVLLAAKPGVWEVEVLYGEEVFKETMEKAEAEEKKVEWRF